MMTSFELDIVDDKSLAGVQFLVRIVEEMRRALVVEKSERKLTQQSIADKIGTSRHVINRELQGLENISARRIGEFFWAIGWEPHFEARRVPSRINDIVRDAAVAPRETDLDNQESRVSALDDRRDKNARAADMAYIR
jgi:hypothetical protein